MMQGPLRGAADIPVLILSLPLARASRYACVVSGQDAQHLRFECRERGKRTQVAIDRYRDLCRDCALQNWASEDGQRFLIDRPLAKDAALSITAILD